MPDVKRVGSVQILGLGDLTNKLKGFAERDSRRIVKRSMQAGARVIQKEAIRLAPAQELPGGGTLKKSIKVSSERRKQSDVMRVYILIKAPKKSKGKAKAKKTADGSITVQKNPRKYAHLVEFGTRPHALGRGSKLDQTIKRRVREGTYQTGAMHPGAKKKPFMRPAFDHKHREAIGAAARTFFAETGKVLGVDLGPPPPVASDPEVNQEINE